MAVEKKVKLLFKGTKATSFNAPGGTVKGEPDKTTEVTQAQANWLLDFGGWMRPADEAPDEAPKPAPKP